MHMHHWLPVHSCFNLVRCSLSFLQWGHLKSIGCLFPNSRGTRINLRCFSANRNSLNFPASLFFLPFALGTTYGSGGVISWRIWPLNERGGTALYYLLSSVMFYWCSFYAFLTSWTPDLGGLISLVLTSSSIFKFSSPSLSALLFLPSFEMAAPLSSYILTEACTILCVASGLISTFWSSLLVLYNYWFWSYLRSTCGSVSWFSIKG